RDYLLHRDAGDSKNAPLDFFHSSSQLFLLRSTASDGKNGQRGGQSEQDHERELRVAEGRAAHELPRLSIHQKTVRLILKAVSVEPDREKHGIAPQVEEERVDVHVARTTGYSLRGNGLLPLERQGPGSGACSAAAQPEVLHRVGTEVLAPVRLSARKIVR